MKRFILSSILTGVSLLFGVVSVAQTITGHIYDENNKPLVCVNLMLFNPQDNTYVQGAVSGEEGSFSFNISEGRYLLRTSEIGYEKLDTLVTLVNGITLTMREDAHLLGEVTVKGTRPQYRMVNGGVSIDVKNSVLAQVGDALDVLRELPRVDVDGKGAVTVTAKGTPLIYINNRLVRDMKELNRLKSSDIKNVEVITSPGARYDASVSSVIRIITDKKPGEGWSFRTENNVRTNYEKFGYYTEEYVKYRNKGLEIEGSGLFNSGMFKEKQTVLTDIRAQDHVAMESKEKLSQSGINNANAYLGINYDFNKNHSFGVSYNFNTVTSRTPTRYNMTSNVMRNGAFDDLLLCKNSMLEVPTSHDANAYYMGKMGKLDIVLDLTYMRSKGRKENDIDEESQMAESRTVHTLSRSDGTLWAQKLVLEYPVWKGTLSVGDEFTSSKTRGDYENREALIKPSNTEISEYNVAAFAQYNLSLGNWNAAAGVRYEHVKSDYYVFSVWQEAQSRRYNDVFPNASIAWNKNGWGLQLAYTYKTSRPNYSRLRDDVQYDNRYLYEGGNPYLRPCVSHSLDFSALHKWWSFAMGYRYCKDDFNYLLGLYQNEAIGYGVYRNFDHTQNVYASLVLSPKFRWYQPQLETTYKQQFMDREPYGVTADLNKPTFNIKLKNRLVFKHDLNVLFDLNYTTNLYRYMVKQQQGFVANLRITKSFMNRRLTLNLLASDVFHTWRKKMNIYGTNMDLYKDCDSGTSQLNLTVTYRFNTTRSRYKGTGAGKAEKNRM